MVVFAPLVINSLVYVTQYIHIMYISMSNIYIIHIYLSTPVFQCTSSHATGRPVPPIFTVTPSALFFLAFLFFLSCPPEDITKIYVFFFLCDRCCL